MPDGSTCRSSRSIAWHEQRNDQFADRRAALRADHAGRPRFTSNCQRTAAYAAATHGRQRQRVLSAIDSNPYGGVAAPSPALSIVAGPRQQARLDRRGRAGHPHDKMSPLAITARALSTRSIPARADRRRGLVQRVPPAHLARRPDAERALRRPLSGQPSPAL